MIESADLDWLARNVHEWPAGEHQSWCYVGRDYLSGDMRASGHTIRMVQPGLVRRDDWLARRAELQNKPSFADHSDAKCFVQNAHGLWFKNIVTDEVEPNGGGWRMDCDGYQRDGFVLLTLDGSARRGEVLGNWRDTLERRPADLSEPAVTERLAEATQNVLAAVPALKDEKYRFEFEPKPADVYKTGSGIDTSAERVQKRPESIRNWHESGELPPVGVFVDVTGDVAYGEGEKSCEVIAHVEDCAVIRMSWGLGCFVSRALSPHRTERDELVDIIASNGFLGRDGEACYLIADAIISAGFERNCGKS